MRVLVRLSHPRPPDRNQHGCTVGVLPTRVLPMPRQYGIGRRAPTRAVLSCAASWCLVVRRPRRRVDCLVLTFCYVSCRRTEWKNVTQKTHRKKRRKMHKNDRKVQEDRKGQKKNLGGASQTRKSIASRGRAERKKPEKTMEKETKKRRARFAARQKRTKKNSVPRAARATAKRRQHGKKNLYTFRHCLPRNSQTEASKRKILFLIYFLTKPKALFSTF